LNDNKQQLDQEKDSSGDRNQSNNTSSSDQGKMSGVLLQDMKYLNQQLAVDMNFDVVYRVIYIGGREACLYFIDGFCKDDMMQKLLQYFLSITPEDMPEDAHGMSKHNIPTTEVDLQDKWESILYFLLSGVFVILIDGYTKALLIDARTYPARSVSEPEKDKVLRGSKDGFVETLVMNTALIRRRIRSTELRVEMMSAGQSSHTDIALCYMDSRVDKTFLDDIKKKIQNIKVDALTMNQESLAECLFNSKWYNPFPKFKYTERPDTAAAQILEGNVIALVDTSPSAMIMPTSIFDVVEEADDYYFPPITGSYLRITRFLISILTYIMTPTFLLLMSHQEWIPSNFSFIVVKEASNIPLLAQFLILELALDGLRLAAVSTPNMLSTPLSVMAALVLGEFSVKSGWFNSEVMLYMAFVAIANYTQSNYELSYALKFMRMITLILTGIFGLWGYIAGIIICILAVATNKTISHQSYIYPLFPLNPKRLANRLLRPRLPGALSKQEHPKSR
jgi:stage V sporulation protein AF